MQQGESHKLRKISDAVFRGKMGRYIFKVYHLTDEITDQPAVFIISRRIKDRSGKGHHAAVCIGETGSIARELKKHKRAKCTKLYAANVVCILKEPDEQVRNRVIDDLETARTFKCFRNDHNFISKPRRIESPILNGNAQKTKAAANKLSTPKTKPSNSERQRNTAKKVLSKKKKSDIQGPKRADNSRAVKSVKGGGLNS